MSNKLEFPYVQIPDPNRGGKVLFNASIYVGLPDTNPTTPANQLRLYYVDENGNEINLSQPVKTSVAGLTVNTNGDEVSVRVDTTGTAYSLLINDRNGNQQYYDQNVTISTSTTAASSVTTKGGGTVQGFIDGQGFTDVAEAINFTGIAGLSGQRVYIEDRGAWFRVVDTTSVTPNTYTVIQSAANAAYSFTIDESQEMTSKRTGGLNDTVLTHISTFTNSIFLDTDESPGTLTIPANMVINSDRTKTLASGNIVFNDRSTINNTNIDLSDSENTTSAISSNGASRPMLYRCTITGCPLTLENIRFTDTTGAKVLRCTINGGNRAVVVWGASIACRIRFLRADSQKGICVLLHTSQSSTGGNIQSFGHRLLNCRITNVGRGDSTENPEAHGVQIWGMDAAQATRFHDIYDIEVEDVTVETGTGAGMWTSCARRVKFRNCTVNSVRKEGIDFEGSLDCTNIGSDLYNAGRTFGSLTLIFRCDDCWHIGCTVVHDGDFDLIGGGEHPLTSSLSAYARDANVRSGYKNNTFAARNANNKTTSFTVFKSTVDANSTTGSIALSCDNNEFTNGVIRYLDNCHEPQITSNRMVFTGSYSTGALGRSLYFVNCYEPNVDNNIIKLDNGTVDSSTNPNNAVIFGLYNANPQRGYWAEINRNKIRNLSSGITFQNFYTGRDADGSVKVTENTTPSVNYSATITDFAIANNYSPTDFSAITANPI